MATAMDVNPPLNANSESSPVGSDGIGLDTEFPYKYLVSAEDSANNQFWTSPIQLNIALKNSPFWEAVMNTPQINKGKGTMLISTKNKISIDSNSISLGSWKIICRLLPPKALSYWAN